MYQRAKLYELSVSIKLLLTGFIVAICAAGALGVAAFYHACKDADGNPAISFNDVRISIHGAGRSVLQAAADDPEEFGLASISDDDLERLSTWCRNGAPRGDFAEIARILQDSQLGKREYQGLAALARRHEPISRVHRAAGTALYLAIVSLAFLGLGLMFVRTSLFEKTKVFFVSATFGFAVACPVCLWLARRRAVFIYPMLLSGLLLAVCFLVLGLVALYDIWFRRPMA